MAIYRHRGFATMQGGEVPTPGFAVQQGSRASASARTEAPSPGELWGGAVFFALCVGIGVLFVDSDVRFVPPEGIGAFAVFYVLALAIERLLEFLNDPVEYALKSIGRRSDKSVLELRRDQAVARAAQAAPASSRGDPDPADAQADVNSARLGRSAAIAGLSGGMGALAADYLNADFLAAVGVTGTPEWLALAVTGLVVAGGSKQLHDLITNMSKASAEKSTPNETRAAGVG